MLGIVARLKVKPGMEQEFETVGRQLVWLREIGA